MKFRDIIDPFVLFSTIPISIGVGFGFYALETSWTNYILEGIVGIFAILSGMWGLHSADILVGGLRNTSKDLQRIIFYIGIGIGMGLGIFLCYLTSWWLLALVLSAGFIGISYNTEKFGGLLHDTEKLGLPAFAYAYALVPAFGASIVVGNPSLHIFFLSLTVAFWLAGALLIYKVSAPIIQEKNPFIDNPGRGFALRKSREMGCKAVTMFVIGIWIFMIAMILR